MVSRQTLIALSIAVVLGLFAVFLANSYLTAANEKIEKSGTTKIAVAAVPLEYGTELTPARVRFADYPNTSIPAGSFVSIGQLLPQGQKRVALMRIEPNEPILPNKISAAGEGASIAALLPEGMRATSVRINDVSGVAGFIQPNDSVDVLVTRSIEGRSGQVSDVLLQSVRVLAIGHQQQGAEGKPISAKTATLLVDQVGAQKLALAQQVGTLSLVLRKPGEQDNPVVDTVNLDDLRYSLYGGVRYPEQASAGAFQVAQEAAPKPVARPRARKPAAPRRPSGHQVEVYRGTQSNSYTVGG